MYIPMCQPTAASNKLHSSFKQQNVYIEVFTSKLMMLYV